MFLSALLDIIFQPKMPCKFHRLVFVLLYLCIMLATENLPGADKG